MRIRAATVCVVALAAATVASGQETKPDPWAPVRFLVGSWQGSTSGQPGEGTVSRQYEFILGKRFIHERNTSTYPPQERNKKGETHEHWSFISYDRVRKVLVLRQFHIEGFVIQYSLRPEQSGAEKLASRQAIRGLRQEPLQARYSLIPGRALAGIARPELPA